MSASAWIHNNILNCDIFLRTFLYRPKHKVALFLHQPLTPPIKTIQGPQLRPRPQLIGRAAQPHRRVQMTS